MGREGRELREFTEEQLKERFNALVQATEQLIQASRSFRLAWIDQKCGIGIHHGHLEAAEQVAKRAIRGEVELPAQDRGEEEPPLPCSTCQERIDHGCVNDDCPHGREN